VDIDRENPRRSIYCPLTIQDRKRQKIDECLGLAFKLSLKSEICPISTHKRTNRQFLSLKLKFGDRRKECRHDWNPQIPKRKKPIKYLSELYLTNKF